MTNQLIGQTKDVCYKDAFMHFATLKRQAHASSCNKERTILQKQLTSDIKMQYLPVYLRFIILQTDIKPTLN